MRKRIAHMRSTGVSTLVLGLLLLAVYAVISVFPGPGSSHSLLLTAVFTLGAVLTALGGIRAAIFVVRRVCEGPSGIGKIASGRECRP